MQERLYVFLNSTFLITEVCMARWSVDVRLVDVNGMETVTNVEVEAPDAEGAGEAAKEAAIEQTEFTGAHVSMTAHVADKDIRPVG